MTRISESGVAIQPVYEPESLRGFDPATELAEPGEYPFTRGVYPGMYTKRPWTMRQYAGFSTAADSNRRYHQLIEAGTTGLSVAFDLPTQMGYDPDAPVEHHLDLRLSHGGSRRDARPGDRVHAGQRQGVRAGRDRIWPGGRRVRAAPVVLLRGADDAARGGREVPRRAAAVGPDHARGVRGRRPQVADAPVPHPDRGAAADRSAAPGEPR